MTAEKYYFLGFATCLLATSVWAQQVNITGAWARPTVAGQTSSAAYMELTANENATLLGVSSPLAGIAEVHEMSMDNGVMKMRARPRLDLPAGKIVVLKPGGYHIMLMELKQPLRKGDRVPLTLKIEGGDKKLNSLEVNAEVRDPGDVNHPAGSSSMENMHHMHMQ
jgi:copper(I)-binding protein